MFSRLRTLAHQLYPRIRSAKISTVHNNNAACCSIPPVQSNYTPKGSFKPYGGFNKVRRSWFALYLLSTRTLMSQSCLLVRGHLAGLCDWTRDSGKNCYRLCLRHFRVSIILPTISHAQVVLKTMLLGSGRRPNKARTSSPRSSRHKCSCLTSSRTVNRGPRRSSPQRRTRRRPSFRRSSGVSLPYSDSAR